MSLQLREETSRCVKCGLCLPECPTYQLTYSEAHSPRGRIALAAALENKQISANRQFQQRMDSCLLCRRCEKVCPSGVMFSYIMDQVRAHKKPRHSGLLALINRIISSPANLRKALASLQWLRPLITTIPVLEPAIILGDYYPAIEPRGGAVSLFKGCTAEAVEPHTLQAAITLLNHAGQDVHIPPNQGCCGALHAHAGDMTKAAELRAANARAFAAPFPQTLISITSGCGAFLQDDKQLPATHTDICAFLAQPSISKRLRFKPLDAVAAIQIPCSQENALGTEQAVLDMLEKIPGLKLRVLGKGHCCGAAGTYFITHRNTAQQLRQPFIRQLEQLQPDFLISSNIGCSLHLLKGLGTKAPKAMHPAGLLAQQLIER